MLVYACTHQTELVPSTSWCTGVLSTQLLKLSLNYLMSATLLLQYNPGPGEYNSTPASTSQAQHPSTCFLSNVSRLYEYRYTSASHLTSFVQS